MRWKEMGKKETTRNSTLIDKMKRNLQSEVHIAGFSFTDIESNLVTWFEMIKAAKKLGKPLRSSDEWLTLYVMQYYVQNKELPLLLLLLNLEL